MRATGKSELWVWLTVEVHPNWFTHGVHNGWNTEGVADEHTGIWSDTGQAGINPLTVAPDVRLVRRVSVVPSCADNPWIPVD